MLRRLNQRLLLSPEDIEPSRDDFEVIGAFNPGAVAVNGDVVLLVRVAERPAERREGWVPVPRWDPVEKLTVDWFADEGLNLDDPRGVVFPDGFSRLTSVSHIRVARSSDGFAIDEISGPVFAPSTEWGEYGIEDARVTKLGDRYYVTYATVSRLGVSAALASTTDFIEFVRHGVVFPPENKDAVIFPELVQGDFVALHRPATSTYNPPQIWVARSGDLIDWGRHQHLAGGVYDWEGGRVGAGPPPIKTAEGWLELHHGSGRAGPGGTGVYAGGAMLLDREDPGRVLRRSAQPILVPETDFELEGFVGGVVFPTGVVETGETLLVYYGAADTCSAVVELSRRDVLAAME
jgi:predicted GH43/DUF377 family glycosyl hydrolase